MSASQPKVVRPVRVTIAAVEKLASDLEAAEILAASIRDRLNATIRRAVSEGEISQSALSRAAGVSRQRVSQVVLRNE